MGKGPVTRKQRKAMGSPSDASASSPNVNQRQREDVEGKGTHARAESLWPVGVKDLKAGTTHKGKVFRGTIIKTGNIGLPNLMEPRRMAAAVFLVEDNAGDISEVAVYNIPGMNTRMVHTVFPWGRRIDIAEPYFGSHGDGRSGIRVKDPSQISNSVTLSEAEMMEQGKDCSYLKKRLSYEELERGKSELAVLLTNRAICLAKMGQHYASLFCASGAAHLNPGNEKAHYWWKEALKNVPKEEEDLVSGGRASRVTGNGDRNRDVLSGSTSQQLRDIGKEQFQKGEWEDADATYAAAVEAHDATASVLELLSELTYCTLDIEESASALAHSSTGIALSGAAMGLQISFWISRARALEGLGDPNCLTVLEGLDFPHVREAAAGIKRRWESKHPVNLVAHKVPQEQHESWEASLRNMFARAQSTGGGGSRDQQRPKPSVPAPRPTCKNQPEPCPTAQTTRAPGPGQSGSSSDLPRDVSDKNLSGGVSSQAHQKPPAGERTDEPAKLTQERGLNSGAGTAEVDLGTFLGRCQVAEQDNPPPAAAVTYEIRNGRIWTSADDVD